MHALMSANDPKRTLKEKVSSRCANQPKRESKWEPRARDLKAMLKTYDPVPMEAYAVNRAVNRVENDTEECVEPAAVDPLLGEWTREDRPRIKGFSWMR